MITIFIVAHVPLASALAACAQHVLGREPEVVVSDILPNECASDCAPNLAQQIIAADQGEGVLGGVNASMLLRAINYRQGSLEDVASSALAGATHALLRVD